MLMALICFFSASFSFMFLMGLVWCICTFSVDPQTAQGAPCELRVYCSLAPNLAIGFIELVSPSFHSVAINSFSSLFSFSDIRYSGTQLAFILFPTGLGIL